jgi:hypothetical protein
MSRPLIVSDCDEVLLHMVAHFRDWLHEETDVEFRMEGADFATALRRPATGETLEKAEIWGGSSKRKWIGSCRSPARSNRSTRWPSTPTW